MKNQLILVVIFLVISVVSIKAAAIDGLPVDFDFYKLYDNPEAHISLKERRSTLDRIAAHEYPVEHHQVLTEDGYTLGLFRIPYSHKLKNEENPRPIVLIQHGMGSCSDIWVLKGPNDALPFLLADAGFDVWLGNARGNTYSKNHTKLSLKHPYFWRFSWHEIGIYDISAMIDYALKTNGQGQKAIHYVGYSQGTTSFFVLMSSRPEYNAKIKTAHMFAPVVIMTHMKNKLVVALGPYLGHQNAYSLLFSDQEFFPHNSFLLNLLFNMCQPDVRFQRVCANVIKTMFSERYNMTAMTEYLGTHPAGCSTNQLIHYLQEQQSGHFRQYDHGPKRNLELYKSEQPPDYSVEKVTAQLHLWYGSNDGMAAVEDVLALADRLPNRDLHHLEDNMWSHGDFAHNNEARKFLYDPAINIMKNFEVDYNKK